MLLWILKLFWPSGRSSSAKPRPIQWREPQPPVPAPKPGPALRPYRPIPTPAPPPGLPRVVEGPARVVDGDTIVIRGQSIRLAGIDAPELNHPYGQQAKWALVALCKGQSVRAEVIDGATSYERLVARCVLPDGRDLAAEMVRQGLALDWDKHSGGVYCALETPDARKKLWRAAAKHKGKFFEKT